MGFLSILSFFCKLSSGTAQMSTSRQAYRLGIRLSTARLLGFYYAHTGYYLAQLHFYHVAYSLYALAFVGSVAEGCELLPGAARATGEPLDVIYNIMYLSFLGAAMLPMVVVFLLENSTPRALWLVLRQVLSASPLYFFVQSRCIGHYLSGEFASGGAAYIPTGRGLAIEHQPFHMLYASFATVCVYPGLELGCFILFAPIAGSYNLGTASLLLALLMPVALLYGPALFNPRCFELDLLLKDLRLWVAWLRDDGPKGWSGHFRAICDKKQGSHPRAVVLPSKEMLISFPLLLIAHEGMRPHGWGFVATTLLAVPLAPFAVVALILVFWRPSPSADAKAEPPQPSVRMLALCVALALFGESVALLGAIPGLSAANVVSLLAARYFSWRYLTNSIAYLITSAKAAAPSADTESAAYLALRAVCLSTLRVATHTAAALLFVSDVLMGLVIQLPCVLIAALPLASTLHLVCLFYTTPRQLGLATGKEQHNHYRSARELFPVTPADEDAQQRRDKKDVQNRLTRFVAKGPTVRRLDNAGAPLASKDDEAQSPTGLGRLPPPRPAACYPPASESVMARMSRMATGLKEMRQRSRRNHEKRRQARAMEASQGAEDADESCGVGSSAAGDSPPKQCAPRVYKDGEAPTSSVHFSADLVA